MNYLRVVWTFFRLGALNELEYRANFFIQILQSGLALAVALGGLAVVFDHTETLGGWGPSELLALVGIHLFVGGLINLVIRPSMQRFMEDVRKGTLDFTLTKPVDVQLMVSVQRVQIWKVVDVALGLFVLLVALVRLGTSMGVVQATAFGVALLAGGLIVYSFWLMLSTTAFWFVRVENLLVIFSSMYVAGRWPVGIYPGWLRLTLTFIVPVAFAVTVPAEGLTGRLDAQTLALAVGLAAFMLFAARRFWQFGVRHYSGASA